MYLSAKYVLTQTATSEIPRVIPGFHIRIVVPSCCEDHLTRSTLTTSHNAFLAISKFVDLGKGIRFFAGKTDD
jgi:hypothetical protein